MNMQTPDIDSYFKVHNMLDGIAGLFRKFPTVYVYELTGDERYSIDFNPWENMPSVNNDTMKAGSDILVKANVSPRNITLSMKFKRISFEADLKLIRNVELDESTAYIFRDSREKNHWLVVIGSKIEKRSRVSQEIDNAFDKMYQMSKTSTPKR